MRTNRLVLSCISFVGIAALGALMNGCVTVRPEQRSILADPIMKFEGDPQVKGQVQHALDNREGSTGGSGVQGGGCGCN